MLQCQQACQIKRQSPGTSRLSVTRAHLEVVTCGGARRGGEINNMQTSSPPWVADTSTITTQLVRASTNDTGRNIEITAGWKLILLHYDFSCYSFLSCLALWRSERSTRWVIKCCHHEAILHQTDPSDLSETPFPLYTGSSEWSSCLSFAVLSCFCIMLGWTILYDNLSPCSLLTSHSWETWVAVREGQILKEKNWKCNFFSWIL